MPSLSEITLAVYSGYKGDGERHLFRIVGVMVFSALIAAFPAALNKDALSMMGVMVSILAGFSFTALFSGHSHSVQDLPNPRDESDRLDLSVLKELFGNFRDRSKYFLIISIFCLLICLLLLMPIDIEEIKSLLSDYVSDNVFNTAIIVWSALCGLGRATCLFIFLEILYTFYRMSQTIFAIIDTRRRYLEQDRR